MRAGTRSTSPDIWIVPAGRIKGAANNGCRCRTAPSSSSKWCTAGGNAYVFVGTQRGGSLSPMAMNGILKRMERDDITVHGFRSTFRDWAAERTNFPNHVVEMALAHVVGNKVEASYRRGDLFDKRRQLMEAWASYCSRPAGDGTVVVLRSVDA